ncbi:kalirin-like [Glandiceps talaboti]
MASRADSTTLAYSNAFSKWSRFASDHNLTAIPAEPSHVSLYLTHLIQGSLTAGSTKQTVESAFYSIQWAHQIAGLPSPTEHPFVKNLVESARRLLGRPVIKKQPVTTEVISELVEHFKDSSSLKDDKHLSYTRVRELVKQKLSLVVDDVSVFGTHSFRSGGATTAAQAGISSRQLMQHDMNINKVLFLDLIAASRYRDGFRAIDILSILKEKIAFLSGGRDKRGGPILTFPARSVEKIKYEELRKLMMYLASIPSDEARDVGFSVIIDMRHSTWNGVKPLLKVLQECFPSNINMAYIIKPENFWQKHRTSLGSSKLKFETSMISQEGLYRFIDPSQLTQDFDGTLPYDHDEWIELRQALEEFVWQALDLLNKMEKLRVELCDMDFPHDVQGAKEMIDDHANLKRRVLKAPVEYLYTEGQKLIHRLSGTTLEECTTDSGYSGSSSSSSMTSANADFHGALPRISNLLKNLHSKREYLQEMWHARKLKLDQCFQMRVFEQDCEKMFDWIGHNRELFLVNYTEIGQESSMAIELQDEHRNFKSQSLNAYANINRIMSVANRLSEAGHYASYEIRLTATRLDREWKTFAAGLDERSTLLAMSVSFHKKAEDYLSHVYEWVDECQLVNIPSEPGDLEDMLTDHEKVYEVMNHSYSEVYYYGKDILDLIQHLQVHHLSNH